MKQINIENEDPLKRIQEEINEVTQRERELRKQLLIRSSSNIPNGIDQIGYNGHSMKSDFEDSQYTPQSIDMLNNNSSSDHSNENLNDHSHENENLNGHSENHYKKQKSIQPRSAFRQTSSPILMRARSTPQIYTPTFNKKINGTSIQKGLMQKFIESRGKILGTKQPQNQNNSISHHNNNNSSHMPILNDFHVKTTLSLEPTTITSSPAQIERDSEGRPIRRGYVPVEEKIQNELRDIRNREVELKKLRRQIVQNQTSNGSLTDDEYDFDDDDDEDDDDDREQYNYDYPPPGKLRTSRSIGELCNAVNNSSITSLRDSPSPVLAKSKSKSDLRPALSLAQLCDIEPKEVPSSHRLIAQWENLIHQKSQKVL